MRRNFALAALFALPLIGCTQQAPLPAGPQGLGGMQGSTQTPIDAANIPGRGPGAATSGTGAGMQGSTQAPNLPGQFPGQGQAPGRATAGSGAGMQGSTDAPNLPGQFPGSPGNRVR